MFDLSAAFLEVRLQSVLFQTLREGILDEFLLQEDERAVIALVVVIIVGLRIAVRDGVFTVRLFYTRRSF